MNIGSRLKEVRRGKANQKQIADLYQIEFSKGFAGDSAMVYLNDSLVWCDLVPSDTTTLRIHRFADENTLMVSRSANDAVSIFNITHRFLFPVFLSGSRVWNKCILDISIVPFDVHVCI